MQTQLHTYLENMKSRLKEALSVLLFAIPFTGNAQTTITAGSANVCTNFAADGITPYYQTINTIGLTETGSADLGNTAGTFSIDVTLTAPAGWEFHSAHSAGVTFAPGGNVTNVTVTSFTPSALSFTISGAGNDLVDNISIGSLQARQTTTTSTAANVTLSFVGFMNGLSDGANMATLSPLAPTVGTTASPLTGVSATSICSNDNVDFSATASTAMQPIFQWQVNGSDITGATNSTYSTTGLADNDDVTVIVYDHFCIDNPTNSATAITDIEVKPLPTPITGTVVICSNGATTLNSTPASGTWSSSFHTVATINASTGVVDPVEPGNATISYQAPNGCYTAADLTVNPLPSPIDGNIEACVGNSELLTNDDLGGTWASGTTSVATIGTDGTVNAVMGGTTTITYTIATGCQRTEVFTVNALPAVFNVTGTGAYCAGGSGLEVGMNNTAIGHTYDLYNGSSYVTSISGNGSAQAFGTYTAATTYTVVAMNDNTGCVNNMAGDATLTITPLSTPGVTISYTEDTVCAGTAVTFTATPANGGASPIYTWAVNGTAMGTGSTYNYTPANGDVVSVVLTTNVTCPSTPTANDDFAMVVYSNETPAVTINASNTSICQYTPVTFSVATSAHGGTAPVYTWYKGAVSTGITGSNYTYLPADNDAISVKLNSSYRCPTANDVSSSAITMNVDSVYIPVVSITSNTGLEMNPGENVTFTAKVSKAGTATPHYQWYLNKAAINNATSSTYTSNTIKNNDSVSCWVRAAGICNEATPTFNSVRMKFVNTAFVHTTFEGADVQLMPNPNSGVFFVRGTLNTDMDTEVLLEITNMMGQVVYSNRYMALNGNIDTQVQPASTMSNGMYLLTLHAGSERKSFHFVVGQ